MAVGLSEKGFKIKKLADIKSDMENELRSKVDPNLSFDANTIAGNITAIVANQTAQVWESLAGLYHALQPNTASGFSLDALCSLTGTYRKRGDFSRAEAALNLKPNTTVPKGYAVKTISGDVFKLSKEATNSSAEEAKITVELIAQEKGFILANAETEAEIMNPVPGWLKTVFTKTTHIGQLDEEDHELRKRRILELKSNGSSTSNAMRARLSELPDVDGVYIEETQNSFCAYINGGNDQRIAQTIWDCRPIGVETSGDISIEIESDFVFINEKKPSVSFSRPKAIELELTAEVNIKGSFLRNEPDKAKRDELLTKIIKKLKDELVSFSSKNLKMGSMVYIARFYVPLLNQVPVLDVTKLEIKCKKNLPLPTKIKPYEIALLNVNDIHISHQVVG